MADIMDNRGERLAQLEVEVRFIKDLVVDISQKLDTYQRNYVPRNEMMAYEKRLDKLEASLTWAWRTVVIGTFGGLCTLIGVVFEFIKH